MTGAELRHFRRDRLGLSQAALAKALGYSTSTIHRWERGLLPIPRLLYRALHDLSAPKRNRTQRGDLPKDPLLREIALHVQAKRAAWHAGVQARHEESEGRRAEAEARRSEATRAAELGIDAPLPKRSPRPGGPYCRPLTAAELERLAAILARPPPRPGRVAPAFCPRCAGRPLEELDLTLRVAAGWHTAEVRCQHGDSGVVLALEMAEPGGPVQPPPVATIGDAPAVGRAPVYDDAARIAAEMAGRAFCESTRDDD